MGTHTDSLQRQLREIRHLRKVSAVLTWDHDTQMPVRGAEARADVLGILARLTHERVSSDRLGDTLALAELEVSSLPYDSDEASVVRVARRDWDESRRVPASLVAEIARHNVLAHEVWVQARKDGHFAPFAPYLQRTLELLRSRAEFLGYEDCMYDALLQVYEPGMKTAEVRTIFNELKSGLVPLARAVAERGATVDDSVIHQPFDEGVQEAFSMMAVERFGYDFSRGRLDRAVHPFETSFSRNDVRITTRYTSGSLNPAMFGTMHEAGHAMYEQGVSPALDEGPLGRGVSSSLHESQSRMWENVVGRSRSFWHHFYPLLQSAFPSQLGEVPLDTFYGAINKVHPSFIRVEADEITYNLHIMLRFELELALLDGSLSVADAPAAWNDKSREYLGITPPSDTLGILQDVHWSGGMMGYFPTYTLGNILSVALYDTAVQAHPTIPDEIEQGRFDTLRGWMTEHIYRHGRKFEPKELVLRATGEPLQSRSYLNYLTTKFGELYHL